jgi:hypothetical protein
LGRGQATAALEARSGTGPQAQSRATNSKTNASQQPELRRRQREAFVDPAGHAASPDCVIELAFKFDAVQADLNGVGTLVALAANVTDHADELRVIQQLSLASQRFLEQLKYHRLILSSVMSNCADNDAVAKSQEVSHTWGDAASLIQSIVKKIGASPQ